MGYCINQTDSKFHVPASKFTDALAAVKALMLDTAAMNGGSWSGSKKVESYYSWVNTAAVLESNTLVDALSAWRWKAYCVDSDDVTIISFQGEKLGQDTILFNAIAPYVTAGSYIAMRGEDGLVWRWYFNGIECSKQGGKVIYE